MAKTPLNWQDAFPETVRMLSGNGVLLNSLGSDGTPNTMTIGWATFGVIWGRPMAIVFVRPSRHTYGLMAQTPDFTINVLPDTMSSDLAFCGERSGRDVDKFAERGLTLVAGKEVKTPAIEQAAIVFECRTLHRNDLVPAEVDPAVVERYYPEGDFHRCYFGEILACYGNLS
ncbi:MAG: flavin reductase family protein [Armatimonadetes bacterium]|jgi:flavin reductase (DIM6/NTAB) family NADH-FMN oxidoreductase RutF|nr:flavin reductase family protein [Armatimonadota bacterium]MDI9600968.1 flavin reductase family protein [Acidobacteriota bacterium]NLN88729.1 flavin reductase family protein [candidate division WS1 bacterium]